MKYKLIVGALIIVTAQASSVWGQSPRDLSSLFLNGDIYLTHEDGQPYSGSVVVTDPNRGTKEFGTLRDGLRHGGFEWFFD